MSLTSNLAAKAAPARKNTKQDECRNAASVDTLKLIIPSADYRINGTNNLTVEPGDKYLWTDNLGNEVFGESASHVASDIHVRLHKYSPNPNLPANCYVSFSAPKVYFGNNALPIGKEQFFDVLESVGGFLADIGIITNIHEAIVSRIDIFRNIELSQEIAAYLPVLHETRFPYLTRRREYETTTLIHNKQRTVIFYDKVAELCKKDNTKVANSLSKNTLRCEYRFKKAAAARTALNPLRKAKAHEPLTANDLLNHYDQLMEYHINESRKYFKSKSKTGSPFWDNPEYAELPPEESYQIQVKFLFKKFGRNARRELLMIQVIEATFPGADKGDTRNQILEDLLKEKSSNSRSNTTRQHAARSKRLGLAILPSNIPYGVLDKELSEKLCSH